MTMWVQTLTGKAFDLLNPHPSMVCLEDIAHALSMQCRYNGMTFDFYSVAEHSTLVCNIAPFTFWKEALMHDAVEAYIGDIVSPLKRAMKKHCHPDMQLAPLEEIERGVAAAVAEAFELDFHSEAAVEAVRTADLAMLHREAAFFFPEEKRPASWNLPEVDIDAANRQPLLCLPPKRAKEAFLLHARALRKIATSNPTRAHV